MRVGLSIVLLKPDDIAVLENVHPDVFDEPVRMDRAKAHLADPANHMMVAMHDGLVVAQVAAVIHRHPDKVTELYIDEVGVAEPWRRRGLAREMLKRMFAHAKAQGCEEVWVGTEPDNGPARKLYESLQHAFDGGPAEEFVMYVYNLRA
jgi:ribosomal protein S18 acetylase RimI-like enzyme